MADDVLDVIAKDINNRYPNKNEPIYIETIMSVISTYDDEILESVIAKLRDDYNREVQG